MQHNAYVAGVGMTVFGKHLGKGSKPQAGEPMTSALYDVVLACDNHAAAFVLTLLTR